MIANLGYAQVVQSSETETAQIEITFDSQEKIPTFIIHSENHDHDHESHIGHNHGHEQQLSLLDIISSDEGADFNCSGGFCMNEAHYHKKGLTLKRQLFVYFMSISC